MNYRDLNRRVMTNTKKLYETNDYLVRMVRESINSQFVVWHEDNIGLPQNEKFNTEYIVSGNRTFAEAQEWTKLGYKVAVLNFANNHSIGGAPFSAGAQEESLCRCSTLLPCLEALANDFYQKHKGQYEAGEINYMGNDDLIYTPNICVFKTDELASDPYPIFPRLMPQESWYCVDVITCAAPELRHGNPMPTDYEMQISRRIKKILDVAQKQDIEVLILGAWGCGAFRNPEDVVARAFRTQLKYYNFKTVVFAMGRRDFEHSAFYHEFSGCHSPKSQILTLLHSTGRENIEHVCKWIENNNFFEAPASVKHHNNTRGGLARHSLAVCNKALELNVDLPRNSVIICSLLHDICKSDQYMLNENQQPCRNPEKICKGHGRRSMFILKLACKLPLNYEEEMAIWWHMGEYEESKDRFKEEYEASKNIKLCRLIQKADALVAKS